MKTDIKTVRDEDGVPVLPIIKQRNELLIWEADNMDSHIKLRVATAATLVDMLQGLG